MSGRKRTCRAVGCRNDHCCVVWLRDVYVPLCEVHAARAAHTRARSVRGLDFPLKPHQPPRLRPENEADEEAS